MTPKEKAKELVESYLKIEIEIGGQHDGYITMKLHDAKECALITVNECLKAVEHEAHAQMGEQIRTLLFWFEVKSEIENL